MCIEKKKKRRRRRRTEKEKKRNIYILRLTRRNISLKLFHLFIIFFSSFLYRHRHRSKMNINTSETNNDEQQLIPMYRLPINGEIDDMNKQIQSEIKEQKFLLKILLCPFQIFRSFHFPRFSDRSLRITFLLFITLIGLTSFGMALIVGSSIVQFKQQCPLYATFKFHTFITTDSNWTIRIVPLSERFSSQSTCDFCTFYNVFTFIYCIMTGFFFVLFNGDQRVVSTNDRCLIIPW